MSIVSGLRRILPQRLVEAASAVTRPRNVVSSLERSPIGGDLASFSHTALADFCKVNNLQSQVEMKQFLAKHATSENLLGKGQDYRVYAMGDDYVLRIPNDRHFVNFNGLVALSDDLGDRNFGQAIARNIKDVEIAKRVPGKSLYSDFKRPWVDYVYDDVLVGKEEAQIFFKQQEEVASIPQSAFDKYLENVRFLSWRHYEIDFHNPNNFLYDEATQSINILDVRKASPKSPPLLYANFAKPFMDYRLYERYYEFLSPEQRQKSSYLAIDVFKKLGESCRKVGLPFEEPRKIQIMRAERNSIDFNDPYYFRTMHLHGRVPFPEFDGVTQF